MSVLKTPIKNTISSEISQDVLRLLEILDNVIKGIETSGLFDMSKVSYSSLIIRDPTEYSCVEALRENKKKAMKKDVKKNLKDTLGSLFN